MGRVLLLGELSPFLPPLEIHVNRAVMSSFLSKTCHFMPGTFHMIFQKKMDEYRLNLYRVIRYSSATQK